MDAYAQLIDDSDSLRALIQRWRSTPRNTAALLPDTARALRTTAAAKEEVLYPAIRRHDPARGALVDDAERTNAHVEGFLSAAQRLGPEGPGFLDQAHAAAAAADELLIHERRDLYPALRGKSLRETELARIVDRFRTSKAMHEDDADTPPQTAGRVGREGTH